MKTKVTLAVLGIMLGTAACQKDEMVEPVLTDTKSGDVTSASLSPAPDITRVKWTLAGQDMNTSVYPHAQPWFLLDGTGGVAGFTGCNEMSGAYRLEGDQLRLVKLLYTRIYCASVARTEQEYLEVLRATDRYRVEDDQLILMQGRRDLARFQVL